MEHGSRGVREPEGSRVASSEDGSGQAGISIDTTAGRSVDMDKDSPVTQGLLMIQPGGDHEACQLGGATAGQAAFGRRGDLILAQHLSS